MTRTDLKQLSEAIPHGKKTELAMKLKCDPAKITKALNGFVRSPTFMADLVREANELIREPQTA